MSAVPPITLQWADASPAGLFSLGAGTTAVWVALTGRAGPADMPVLVVWLLAVALVQVMAGLVALRRGDSLGGSLNLVFGVLFWAAPAATTALLAFPIGGPPPAQLTLVMNGWVFAFLCIVLVAYIPLMAAQSKLLFVAMVFSRSPSHCSPRSTCRCWPQSRIDDERIGRLSPQPVIDQLEIRCANERADIERLEQLVAFLGQ